MATNPFGPPPGKKGSSSEKATFTKFVNANHIDHKVAGDIWYWANQHHISPTYYAAVLVVESGADPNMGTNKSGHGTGIAQINPATWVGQKVPWDTSKTITQSMLDDYGFNIRFGAWYLAKNVGAYGYKYAYAGTPGSISGGYNHGGTEGDAQLQTLLPKGYIPAGTGTNPTQPPATRVKAGSTTFATIQKNGKFKFVTTPNDFNADTGEKIPRVPKGTIMRFGEPLTKSTFLQDYSQLADTYFAFTGKNPTYTQAATLLHAGLSPDGIKQKLVDGPSFYNSPVWKQNAPRYSDVYHTIFGPDQPVPKELVKYAIANSLDQSGFGDFLRQQPNYVKSAEFKQNTLTLENVFRQIYGEPNAQDGPTIYQAALHGYDSNQFASYLRAQPNYTSSPEYLTRATQFLDAMGLITGNQAVLRPGTNPSQLLPGPTIPNDPRGPQISPLHGINLVPGMSE